MSKTFLANFLAGLLGIFIGVILVYFLFSPSTHLEKKLMVDELCLGGVCRSSWPTYTNITDTRCDTPGECSQLCIGNECRNEWPKVCVMVEKKTELIVGSTKLPARVKIECPPGMRIKKFCESGWLGVRDLRDLHKAYAEVLWKCDEGVFERIGVIGIIGESSYEEKSPGPEDSERAKAWVHYMRALCCKE